MESSVDWRSMENDFSLHCDDVKEDFFSDQEVQEVLKNQLASRDIQNDVKVSNPRRKRKSGECGHANNKKKELGIRWCDDRRSAFTPYRASTTLTNLSRGNVKTHVQEVTPDEVSLFQLAAQGELTAESLASGTEGEVDLTAGDDQGLTLLMWAAAHGQCKTVELLLDHGSDPNQEGIDDCTALLLAASGGHSEVIKRLLRAGARLDHHDENWNTALMYACYNDHAMAVHELLSAGADFTVENLCEDTALSLCVKRQALAAKSVVEKYFLKVLSGRLHASFPLVGRGDFNRSQQQ